MTNQDGTTEFITREREIRDRIERQCEARRQQYAEDRENALPPDQARKLIAEWRSRKR